VGSDLQTSPRPVTAHSFTLHVSEETPDRAGVLHEVDVEHLAAVVGTAAEDLLTVKGSGKSFGGSCSAE
jgi:hypothetical protein